MNYTITVTAQGAQVIMNALAAQPYIQVADLYQNLAMQLRAQEQAPPPPTDAELEGAPAGANGKHNAKLEGAPA
jgi:hypothetical protein